MDCLSRKIAAAYIVVALCFSSSPGWANQISGSFTGVAIDSQLGPPGDPYDTNFNGTPITGTFDFVVQSSDNIFVPYVFSVFDFQYMLFVQGKEQVFNYDYPNYDPLYTTTFAEEQVVAFSGNLYGDQSFPEYTSGGFGYAGTNLFDPNDPTTLLPGTIDYTDSFLDEAFFARDTLYSGIQFTSINFDQVAVPEPSSAFLYFGGLAAVTSCLLWRRNRAPHGRPSDKAW